MSALSVKLVKIPTMCAKILKEASAVRKPTALPDITEIPRAESKRNRKVRVREIKER